MKTNLYKTSEIIDISIESANTKTFTLKLEAPFEFKIGQYILIKFDINGEIKNRAYSICSSPKKAMNQKIIQITIKKEEKNGFTSVWLFDNWKIGTKLNFMGPFGNFINKELEDHKELLIIAGGVGITPFKSMLDHITEENMDTKITLLYCTQSNETVIYKDYWSKFKNVANIKIYLLLSREINIKYENTILSRLNSKLFQKMYNKSNILYCGSFILFEKLINIIDELKIDKELLHTELFGFEKE